MTLPFAGLHPLGVLQSKFPDLLGKAEDAPGLLKQLLERARELDLGEEAVFLSWELVRSVAGLQAAERRALLLLLLASWVNRRQGSTRLPLPKAAAIWAGSREDCDQSSDEDAWFTVTLTALGATGQDQESALQLLHDPAKLEAILGRPGDYKPLIIDGDALYHQIMHRREVALAERLQRRLDQALQVGAEAQKALTRVLAETSGAGKTFTLASLQRQAVLCAATAPLAIITGGPGTGKTSVVVTLLRLLGQMGLKNSDIGLAAPTGKAAYRLTEAVRLSAGLDAPDGEDAVQAASSVEARTLHRLLGYQPSRDCFAFHEGNRLSEKVIIVDESSMIDLALMDRLLRALADDARLVLLGDADQLPSVEAGAVFRDLVAWARLHSAAGLTMVELTERYRQQTSEAGGRAIYQLGEQVRLGDAAQMMADLPEHRCAAASAALDQPGMSWLEVDHAGRLYFLAEWHERRTRALADAGCFDRVYMLDINGFYPDDHAALQQLWRVAGSSQILCLTREQPHAGSVAINEWLHNRSLAADAKPAGGFYAVGEPLLMLRNDYALGLFNGDMGLVLHVADAQGVEHQRAVFPREQGFAVFALDALAGAITSAFAVTVHKAQGSEYDRVALILPERDVPLLNRELLYTAVTRARRQVVLVGSGELLKRGVERVIPRFSGLAERLR